MSFPSHAEILAAVDCAGREVDDFYVADFSDAAELDASIEGAEPQLKVRPMKMGKLIASAGPAKIAKPSAPSLPPVSAEPPKVDAATDLANRAVMGKLTKAEKAELLTRAAQPKPPVKVTPAAKGKAKGPKTAKLKAAADVAYENRVVTVKPRKGGAYVYIERGAWRDLKVVCTGLHTDGRAIVAKASDPTGRTIFASFRNLAALAA